MQERKERDSKDGFDVEPYREGGHPLSTKIRSLEAGAEEDMHLRDYLGVLLRRKWIVTVFFVSVVVTVTISSFMMRPLYKSEVTIRIDKEDPNVLTFKDIYQLERAEVDYYQTQYKTLKSRNMARRVIKKLNLEEGAEFMPERSALAHLRDAVWGLLPMGGPSPDAFGVQDGVKAATVDAFIKRLEVNPLEKSRLVNVSFLSYDPGLAKTTANTIADTYIEFNIESKLDATKKARQWLEGQIDVLKGKVEASEEGLNEYAAGNEMIFVGEGEEKESLLARKLAEISTALSEATTKRIEKEALWREVAEFGAENPAVLGAPVIQGLKRQHSEVESEYFNLLRVYKPEYPKMKRMESQMASIAERMALEKSNIVSSIESDYRAALKREAYLSKLFDSHKRGALDFQRRSVKYQILKREVDTNKELFNNMLQRLKEITVSATVTATNIQVLDGAEYPKAPFKPKKAKNILLSVLAGLMGGALLAFFVEYLDNTVKETQEIEEKIRLPSLGIIPAQRAGETGGGALTAFGQTKGPLAEAFRSVGTYILLSSATKPPKTILVTSPRAKEGKSTITMNTAKSLTEYYGKVIIVDADLRKARMHKIFGTDNSVGLSSILSGNAEFSAECIKSTPVSGLHILPSGPLPPNPSALLGSPRMKDLLDVLNTLYDFVIIDSAPVLGMTDSVYLGSFVEGVILVARAGQTPKGALKEVKKIFELVNANVLGVVLNGIKENDLKYGYYSYYYSYYNKDYS